MGYRFTAAFAIALLGVASAPLHFAGAVDMNPNSITPSPNQPNTTTKPAPQPTTTDKEKQKPKDNTNQGKPKDQSELFLEGYKAAHALIYQKHDYVAGIAKLKSIGQDDHPDVANLIGYSSRKLGRYDDAHQLLRLRPELVKLDLARGANISFESAFYCPDFSQSSRVDVPRAFDEISATGAFGHPEKATGDKGEELFTVASREVVAFVREFAAWKPFPPH
jgi:hypothetical protein